MVDISTLLYGAACGAAAVYVAPAAVALVGFKAGGIIAGSYAAGLMSSMSVGGATSAGGIIATMQSIGATGTVLGSGIATGVTALSGSYFGVLLRSLW